MMRGLWGNFLTGLLVILPAALTLLILQFLFGWAVRLVINPVADLITPFTAPGWALAVARVAVAAGFVLFVALLGVGTRVLVVRRFFSVGEALFRRLPMVGKIYGAIREIANAFGGGRRGAFSRVVLLEWPRKGLYALGFVTSEGKGEVQEKTPEHVVNVFVPTTPNPTSGYLILASSEALIPLEMSVEDGMRLVISGGMVGPEIKAPKGSGGMGDPKD
ncbi:MAG: DUF502 domain-containing protein [Candidatus Omnitrophica bacterium]|nr:DUF502 domain-containing protein [Candidatus Omnitrophota bacterium]